MESYNMKPIYLLTEELNYELRIRGVNAGRKDAAAKRKILHRLLETDRNRNINYIDPNFDYNTEKEIIENTLESIKSLINDFEGPASDSMYKRIETRLCHIYNRVLRMPIPVDNEAEAKEFKDDSHATCIEFDADLREKVSENELSQVNNPGPSTSIHNPVTIRRSVSPNQNIRKSVPVYKWNLKFDAKQMSVHTFLEQVNELSVSRNVDKQELFSSATDLFDGPAKLWFKNIVSKKLATDWDSLVKLLMRDFLVESYDDDLWEEIKRRTQGEKEPIHIYVATMESYFSRLSRSPAEITKLKIIRERILPRYTSRIALIDIKDTDELCTVCRRLDEADRIKQNYAPPPKSSQVFQTDLAYLGESSSSSASTSTYSQKNKYRGKTKNVSTVTCWNCQKPNHTFQTCREKPRIFCFKCGNANVTSRNCTRCQKNH